MTSSLKRSLVSEVFADAIENQAVLIKGMVINLRDFKNHAFLVVRDRTASVQTVLSKNANTQVPKPGSFVELEGQVKIQEKAIGGKEIHSSSVTILGQPASELPVMLEISGKENLETELDHRAVSLRNPWINAAFRIQALVGKAFRESMEAQGLLEMHSTKLVAGGTEGGAEVFKIDYFGRPMFLAQSPQLYKQIAVGAFEGVYEIGAVYRAENSQTSRHLTEFTGLDFEVSFIKDEQDVIDVAEHFIRHTFQVLKRDGQNLLSFLKIQLPELGKIPRITYHEGLKLVEKHKTASSDRTPDKAVGEAVLKEFGSPFVFVYWYPKIEKPFYIMPHETDPKLTRSFDILYNGLEISSGGQRIHDYEQLCSSMRAHKLVPESYPAYLEAFEFGMPPHGGAGLGLERFAQMIVGFANIRELTMFPRDVRRVTP